MFLQRVSFTLKCGKAIFKQSRRLKSQNFFLGVNHGHHIDFGKLVNLCPVKKFFSYFDACNSKTLIDDILCNIPTPLVKKAISGNISPSTLDHVLQFFALPAFFSSPPPTKYNIIFHDWENFNNQSFLEDFEKNKLESSPSVKPKKC